MSEDLMKQRMKLICDAVDDYRKGELTDMAAIAAIGIITRKNEPDEGAIEWAKSVFMGCTDCGSDCESCS